MSCNYVKAVGLLLLYSKPFSFWIKSWDKNAVYKISSVLKFCDFSCVGFAYVLVEMKPGQTDEIKKIFLNKE